MIENLPAVQETWVRFLGWDDPLEKGMTTHSSILAWRIPWTEEPGGLQSLGWQRVGHNRMANTQHSAAAAESLSRVRPCATPHRAAQQAPPSLGFSRQELCSGVPLPSPTQHSTTTYKIDN